MEEAGGSRLSLPVKEAAILGSDRLVVGDQNEGKHPGESCSPVASQDAEKTRQNGGQNRGGLDCKRTVIIQ